MTRRDKLLQCVAALKELRSALELVASQFKDVGLLAEATQLMVAALAEETLSTPPEE